MPPIVEYNLLWPDEVRQASSGGKIAQAWLIYII